MSLTMCSLDIHYLIDVLEISLIANWPVGIDCNQSMGTPTPIDEWVAATGRPVHI